MAVLSEEEDLHSVPINSRQKRSVDYDIYPEILLLVDYATYLLFGQNDEAIKIYFTAYMNGVDLRFKPLRKPRVTLSISSMVIAKSRDAMPYLRNNIIEVDAVVGGDTLRDMGLFLNEDRSLPPYDIASAVTK